MRISILTSTLAVATFAATTCAMAQNNLMASSSASKTTPTRSISPARDTATPQRARDVEEKIIPMSMKVRSGVMTVDGLVTKVGLNYDLNSVGFIYFYVPGVGTAIVSQGTFPNAMPLGTFDGSTLTVNTDGHQIELTSKEPLVAGKRAVPAYVFVDKEFRAGERFPMMGFGSVRTAPYQWPGSKAEPSTRVAYQVAPPPPLPRSVIPRLETEGSSYSVTVPAASIARGTQIAAK